MAERTWKAIFSYRLNIWIVAFRTPSSRAVDASVAYDKAKIIWIS